METTHAHFFLHGRGLGAVIGAIVALVGAMVVNRVLSQDPSGIFGPPATIVTALFVGVMAGLLFSSIIIGGREDDRATQEAHEALARGSARDEEHAGTTR